MYVNFGSRFFTGGIIVPNNTKERILESALDIFAALPWIAIGNCVSSHISKEDDEDNQNNDKNRGDTLKAVYMIGGTMGAGKTSLCQKLKKELPISLKEALLVFRFIRN